MSPDTIVLPSAVDNLPGDIVNAAMRVLGQAWSVANAPPGTLPANVIPTSVGVVTQKALALSEAGLLQALGEPLPNALRDLIPDWWGGSPVDPGFNQVLQTTPAGQNFITVLCADLAQPTEEMRREHHALVGTLLALAGGEPVCSNEQLRAQANSIALRTSQAALAAAKPTRMYPACAIEE